MSSFESDLENYLEKYKRHKPTEPQNQQNTSILTGLYTIQEQLGSGAWAKVYRAVRIKDNTTVAIKLINKADLTYLDLTSIRAEAELMKNIDHPNIVREFDYLEDDGHVYLIMEYVEGGELFDRIIHKTVYTEREARDTVFEILSAVHYLHDHHIIHRDLKPENLLMSSGNEDAFVKIADFGSATSAQGFTVTTFCGTPGFIAPEIIEQKPYGKPVDMFAFGVILYILLSGIAPFHDETNEGLFTKVINGEYDFEAPCWKTISASAKDLINGLLTINPHKRLTAEQALSHPWLKENSEILFLSRLDSTQHELKSMQAKRVFKAGVTAVMAINHMKRLVSKSQMIKGPPEIVGLPHTLEDRFDVHEVLGEGGFSVVKLGVHKVTGTKVAVKIMTKEKIKPSELDLLQQEVTILKCFHHPNIVQFYDFFDEDPVNFYLVMEYLAGGELFDRITQRTFYNEKDARSLVYTILSTIKHIHDMDIVHRDLKPENLLMTSKDDNGSIKLVDFGFAVKAVGNTITGQRGTLQYMAPEILEKKTYGKAVDMWAFGVIFYILLSGRSPFRHEEPKKLLNEISDIEPSIIFKNLPTVTFDAKDLIMGLLEYNPARRFTVDQVLKHPWMDQAPKELEKVHLDDKLQELKSYQKSKKFKAGVKAVMAVNKLIRIATPPRSALNFSTSVKSTMSAENTPSSDKNNNSDSGTLKPSNTIENNTSNLNREDKARIRWSGATTR
eukprot:gene12564-16850_t